MLDVIANEEVFMDRHTHLQKNGFCPQISSTIRVGNQSTLSSRVAYVCLSNYFRKLLCITRVISKRINYAMLTVALQISAFIQNFLSRNYITDFMIIETANLNYRNITINQNFKTY